MLDRVSFERGVHLRGTPLWFDAQRTRELCVLTSLLGRLPPVHRRVVATEHVAAALAAVGYGARVLPLPAGQWGGVGGQRLRFLAAPGLGATPVWLEVAAERILVTGVLGREPLDWPAADHVIATVPALEHAGLPFAEVAAIVADFVRAATTKGQRSIVAAECIDVAQALLDALRRADLQPVATGLLAKLATHNAAQSAVAAMAAAPRVCLGVPRRPAGAVLFVDTGLGGLGAPRPRQAEKCVALRWFADPEALGRMVHAVGATAVSLVRVRSVTQRVVDALGGVRWQLLAPQHQLELGA